MCNRLHKLPFLALEMPLSLTLQQKKWNKKHNIFVHIQIND